MRLKNLLVGMSVAGLLWWPVHSATAQGAAAVTVGKTVVQMTKAFLIGIGTGAGEQLGEDLVKETELAKKVLEMFRPPETGEDKTYELPDGLTFKYTFQGWNNEKPIYSVDLLQSSSPKPWEVEPSISSILDSWQPQAAPAPEPAIAEETALAIRQGQVWEVAKIRNETDFYILYYVLNEDQTSWYRNVLGPGEEFFHYRNNMPIVVNFDYDLFSDGYQADQLTIKSSMIIGHEPTQDDIGRAEISVFTISPQNNQVYLGSFSQ
jgi:hypothetical protein